MKFVLKISADLFFYNIIKTEGVQDIMNAAAFGKKYAEWLTPQNIIAMLAVSCYAPFVFTAIAIAVSLVLILLIPEYQRGLFNFRGAFFIPAFCIYAMAVAFFARNALGMIVAPVFFSLLVLMCFVRFNITEKTFEKCCAAVCAMVIPATLYAVCEALTATPDNGKVYRCASYFANANYFGALLAAAIILCARQVIKRKGKAPFYFVSAFFALLGIYLSASLFAVIEVVVGVAVYLLFSKHYRLFSLMVIVGSVGILLITGIPELLPRLSESGDATGYRVRIWGVALRELSGHPFFGKGFMSYAEIHGLYEGSYETVHGHNLALDSLLNFGIFGTMILLLLICFVLRLVVRVYLHDTNSEPAAVIIAVSCAVFAHCFTDITFFWIQTGMFYLFIIGSIGFEEKRLGLKNDMLLCGRYRI